MTAELKPLWTCPKCGHAFVTRNLWHSCGRYSLEDHFKGREPTVREVFDRLVAIAESCGPVTVYAQKTRIVFQVRVRFLGVTTTRTRLDAGVWLTRRVRHPALRRIDEYAAGCYGHLFRLTQPSDIDEELEALVREAYAAGCQEHLRAAPGAAEA